MADKTTVFVEGTFFWAKILRDDQLQDNFDGDGKEWSYDFIPDDDGDFLKPFKIDSRMKAAQPGMPGRFLHLKQRYTQKDGTPNKPIKVEDKDGMLWDKDINIGNGSKGVVKLQIADYGKGTKNIGIYTQAVRVSEHVEAPNNGGFAAYDAKKGDKPAGAAKKPKGKASFELDDDVPF